MANQETSIGRVFLVGCPRSGTTLLQSLLAAHPQITSFPESHFFPALVPRQAWLRLLRIASRGATQRLTDFLDSIADVPQKRKRIPPSRFMRPHVEAFFGALDAVTRSRGKRIWVEKTPLHLHYLPVIARYIPDARFIHILRRGPDVVASLYEVTHDHPEQWGGVRDVDRCIRRWVKDVRMGLDFRDRAGHVIVHYDALTQDPRSELERVCAFLSIPFDETILSEKASAAGGVVRGDEPWKAGAADAIRPPGSRKFHTVFDPEQRRYILARLAESGIDEPELLVPHGAVDRPGELK